MRSGDTVHYKPNGEIWTVAYVEGEWMSWYGWPPGEARVSDCELIEACSDEDHKKSLEVWCSRAGRYDPEHSHDRRSMVCAKQLYELNKAYVGAHI